MSIEFMPPEVDELRPRISVIGVGGAGGNAIANMMASQVQGVDFIVANTDAQAVSYTHLDVYKRQAQPRAEGLITALDIGSWKVSALIAEKTESGEINVLATGQRESQGVKRGYIADMAATERAVREAVEQAERIAGTNIEDVWVSFSAGGLVLSLIHI